MLFVPIAIANLILINDANEPEAVPRIPIMENNIGKALAGKTIEKDFDPSIG